MPVIILQSGHILNYKFLLRLLSCYHVYMCVCVLVSVPVVWILLGGKGGEGMLGVRGGRVCKVLSVCVV